MSNEIINAVKRLERAGSENSRATKKLHDAVRIVADLICDRAPVGVDLPRGYRVVRIRSNVGSANFLEVDGGEDEFGEPTSDLVDGDGGYLHGDFHCPLPAQTRETSLQFAADVADGLLDEISEMLEQRATQTLAHAASLADSVDA